MNAPPLICSNSKFNFFGFFYNCLILDVGMTGEKKNFILFFSSIESDVISCCLAFQTYAEFKVLFSLLFKNRGLYLCTLKQTISLTLKHRFHFLCSCLI